MKQSICQHLDNLTKMEESAISNKTINEAWPEIIRAIQSPNLFAEIEKDQLKALEHILKWELVGSDKAEFDWGSISWQEIKSNASKCVNSICK